MIVTEFYKGQGLGNQLWCYATTRAIALKNGYDFGIESPENFLGRDFMNLDFGKAPFGIINRYTEKELKHPENGSDIREYDKNLMAIADDTKIEGVMQDERYIIEYKNEIRKWFQTKDINISEYTAPDVCVLNFRGGEYTRHPELFLTKKYWTDAMKNMRKINPALKFLIITDDVKSAKKMLPDIPSYHFDIAKDYTILSRTKYLIMSNSSFAWFPAWLNPDLKYCIAPKYWARHNVSNGYWSTGYSLTAGWMYQDKNGMLHDYETCVREFNQYKKTQMRTLDEIALSYGTDKSSLSHNYTKLYALYFENLRHEKLKILEIGIDKGHSLKSWKEYFPNAQITGIDILDLKHFEEERVYVVQGDQSDKEFLKKTNETNGPFDIIIDDGSHHNDHMKASFECLFPLLKQGGIYIVEDLHACYWNRSHGTGEPVFIDLLKRIMDDVNSGGKSGTADRTHDKDDAWYIQEKMSPMTWWEENVEFIHLYRSIVFIKKYPPNYSNYLSNKKERYLTVNDIRPTAHKDRFLKRMFFRTARKAKAILQRIKNT